MTGVASLTAGLLARKGAARPAMRPRQVVGGPDDLGWNDFGDEAPRRVDVRLPTALSVPDEAEPRISDTVDPAAIVRAHLSVAAMPPAARKAFTLRLDAERHLRLRLACAVEQRSAQQLLTDALDHMVAAMPAVERLALGLGPEGRE